LANSGGSSERRAKNSFLVVASSLFNAIIVQPSDHEEKMYGNIIVPDITNEKNK